MVQTIKTAVVVVLLLAVCYGAFIALNAPEPELPESIGIWMDEEDSLDDLVGIDMGEPVASLDAAFPVDPSQLAAESPAPQSAASNPGGGASLGLPSISSVPNNSGTDGTLPAFPALPTLPNNSPPSASMPNVSSAMDASSFPALNTSPPAPKTATAALVGDQRPVADEQGLGSSGNLIPPMLDTPLANAAGGSVSSTPAAYVSTEVSDQARLPTMEFATARSEALKLAEAGELKSALEMLSPYFDSPELGYEERNDLVDILDALCREVIYSRSYFLEPAYVVQPQDTVASVAEAHQITAEFLNAVNGLGDSKALVPGSKLKVLQGPFRAVVGLGSGELTLFLGNLYAGRFPFSTGQDPQPKAGSYAVADRRRDRTYYSAGAVVQADDPRNPYGGYWLHLGQDDMCIHGTPVMASSELENSGCISLAPIDARDVFNILVVDSQVDIRP